MLMFHYIIESYIYKEKVIILMSANDIFRNFKLILLIKFFATPVLIRIYINRGKHKIIFNSNVNFFCFQKRLYKTQVDRNSIDFLGLFRSIFQIFVCIYFFFFVTYLFFFIVMHLFSFFHRSVQIWYSEKSTTVLRLEF